jgi:hypothetical protein
MIENLRVDNSLADRGGDGRAEYQEGGEIEKGGPYDRPLRPQDPGGHNGCD